jgi:hypothetical protein
MDFKNINEKLSKGELPEEFNFTEQKTYNFDWDKIKYNTFYKNYDYIACKFPEPLKNLIGFDKVIENIVNKINEDEKDLIDMFENKNTIELENNIEL